MTASLYLLLPLSVLFVIAIGVAFWWAIFAGQFDDTDQAASSILFDEDTPSSVEEGDDSENADSAKDAKSN